MKYKNEQGRYYSYYATGIRPAPRYNYAKPRRPWYLSPRLAVFVALLMLVGGVYHNVTSSGGSVTAEAEHFVAAPKPPPPRVVDTSLMGQQLDKLIASHPELDISISTVDMESGAAQHYGLPNHFVAASTAKLLTASLFLHEVEQGNASMSKKIANGTADQQLKLLIEQSDNAAWQGFNDYLGHAKLARYAAEIGIKDYNPTVNTITSDGVALLLQKFYARKLLNASNTNLLLSYMQNAKEAQYIPAAVSPGTKVYHKAGYLNDRAHDAAIIDDGKHAYVLVIFTKSRGGYNFKSGINLIHQITAATNQTYLK